MHTPESSLRVPARPSRIGRALVVALLFAALEERLAQAIDLAIPFEGGDQSRLLLGDGTGVIIGLVDSGVDRLHPFLAGNDSLGQPRQVAAANFVTTEPGVTDDIFGHGTAVASAALGKGEIAGVRYDGMATDARYVNARVLNSANQFLSSQWVVNGVGFAVSQGADVINLSLLAGASQSDGNAPLDLLVDYVADSRNILVTLAAGNFGNAVPPHAPAAVRNGLTVGALVDGSENFSRVVSFSDGGPTSDGRSKPDVVAPGFLLHLANAAWDDDPLNPLVSTRSGTSYAAPQAAGLAAQMIEYGAAHGLFDRSPRAADRDHQLRREDARQQRRRLVAHIDPAARRPAGGRADRCLGRGRAVHRRPLRRRIGAAGRLGPARHSRRQHDRVHQRSVYPRRAAAGGFLPRCHAQLEPPRPVQRFRHAGVIDGGDLFSVDPLNPQDNLDLYLLRDGAIVASSISTVDTVEHIHFLVDQPGQYDLRVARFGAIDPGETYALAWRGVPVPEPSTLILLAAGAFALSIRRGRKPQLPR